MLSRNELKFFSKTKNLCNIRGISESYLLELINMEIIRHIPSVKINKVDGNLLHLDGKVIETQHIICATGYHADLSALSNVEIDVDQTTKFPYITGRGESDKIENLFFAGPLAYTRLSSLLIHGCISVVCRARRKALSVVLAFRDGSR